MGFFGLFKKKRIEDDIPPMNPIGNLDMSQRPDFMNPTGPQPDQLLAPQMQSESLLSKDIQVMVSKIDLVNARLENINKRLESLERFIYSQNQPVQSQQPPTIEQQLRKRW